MNKKIILSIIVVAVLVVLYIIIGRQIPIHRSDLKVGSERIYYHETSRLVSCDLAFTDENNQYVYELIKIGNGSCRSDLYVWDGFKSYTINQAIDKGLISLDDFLDSSFVIIRPIVEE